MQAIKFILAFLWCLPLTFILWVFYVLPFWAFGLLEYSRRYKWAIVFVVPEEAPHWWLAAWKDWAGHAGTFFMVLAVDRQRYVDHEYRHVLQFAVLGPLKPLEYALNLLGFGYHDNPSEVDARAHDGVGPDDDLKR